MKDKYEMETVCFLNVRRLAFCEITVRSVTVGYYHYRVDIINFTHCAFPPQRLLEICALMGVVRLDYMSSLTGFEKPE